MPITLSGLIDEDDEFSELVSPNTPRADLVKAPANGVDSWLVMKQDAAGLLDEEFVRDLAKADEPSGRERVTMPNGITISGSPADIAKLMHEGALHYATPAREVAKAEQSTKSQNDLPDSAFAYIEPGGKKDADGKTTPRSLRHFPINDAAHVRNALARATSSPFGDKAMGRIKAAARRFGIEVSKEAGVPDTVTKADVNPDLDDGMDGLDPTVPLAEPGEMGSGSPTDPGSPAWESIDAATACKWTSILARARVAVDMLAEREMLEAAAGDDGDMCNAMDLQDVCCAIDYAIGVLAPFAVAEQSEADCGDMAMAKSAVVLTEIEGGRLTAIRKGAEDERLPGAVATIETFGAIVRKAGRVLSSVNEQRIRTAAASLTDVLSSLPLPVDGDGQPVTKMTPAEEADMPETMPSEEATAASGQQPAMGVKEQPPAAETAIVTKAEDVPEVSVTLTKTTMAVALFDHARRIVGLADPAAVHTDLAAISVTKADGDKAPMMVVYNQAGDLVGIVSPDDITPVANSTADPDDAPAAAADPDGDGTAAAAPATDATDMTPAPPAETGTPSGGVDDVAKQDGTADPQAVLKSTIVEALAELLAAQAPAQDVAKSADVAAVLEEVATLKARLAQVEEQPAAPKVFTNGAVPPAHQMRGQDQGAGRQVDVAKAAELKQTLYKGTAPEQKEAFDQMQQMAVDGLAALYAR